MDAIRAVMSLQRKRETKGVTHLGHPVGVQCRDQGSDLSFGYGLNVIQIHRAGLRHAVCFAERNFGRNISNRRGHGRDGYFPKEVQC
jgi:hypothetical protein